MNIQWVQKQYFLKRPIHDFTWKEYENSNVDDFDSPYVPLAQQAIISSVLNNIIFSTYRDFNAYKKSFLSMYVGQIEKFIETCQQQAPLTSMLRLVSDPADIEVYEPLYTLLIQLLSQRSSELSSFESSAKYLHFLDDSLLSIATAECMISHGTTGLAIWKASLYLSEYILNISNFSDANIIELGSGTGIAGLAAAWKLQKTHKCGTVLLTDLARHDILKQLQQNIEINSHVLQDINVSAIALDWSNLNDEAMALLNSSSVLIAADVVYDKDVVPDLVETIRRFIIKGNSIGYVVCTLRNIETFATFYGKLRSSNLGIWITHLKLDLDYSSETWESMLSQVKNLAPQFRVDDVVVLPLLSSIFLLSEAIQSHNREPVLLFTITKDQFFNE